MFAVDIRQVAVREPKKGNGTIVRSPKELSTFFTASQLNKLSEKYLGKKLSYNRPKLAEKIFPVLEEMVKTGGKAIGQVIKKASPKKTPKAPRSDVKKKQTRSHTYKINAQVHAPDAHLLPQAELLMNGLLQLAKKTGKDTFTKDEITQAIEPGFPTKKGNFWRIFLYYRGTMKKIGVME